MKIYSVYFFSIFLGLNSKIFAQNIDRNVERQCRRAAVDIFDQNLPQFRKMPKEKFLESWTNNSLMHYFAPWYLLMAPDLETRKVSMELTLKLTDESLKQYGNTKPVKELLTELAQKSITYTAENLQQNKQTFSTYKNKPPHPDMIKARQEIPRVCGVYRFAECESALSRIFSIMDSKIVNTKADGIFVSLWDELEEILSDPTYQQALSKVSLKILNYVETNTSPQESVAVEIYNAFRDGSSTHEDALAKTMKFLGFYGSRGNSVGMLVEALGHRQSALIFAPIMIVSTGLSVLDAQIYGENRTYSLPQEVTFKCSYGRPYHFWMGAYLGWKLRMEGFSEGAARFAPHIVGVLYEVAAQARSKTPSRIFFDSFFNPYNVNVQINISQNDHGAKYGSAVALANSLTLDPNWHSSINTSIRTLFANAKPMPSELSIEEITAGVADPMQRFIWFYRVIAPDSGMLADWLGL